MLRNFNIHASTFVRRLEMVKWNDWIVFMEGPTFVVLKCSGRMDSIHGSTSVRRLEMFKWNGWESG